MSTILAQTTSVPEVSVNWLAIIVATIVAMAIGYVWYGPLLGEKWMKLVKLSKNKVQSDWQKPMIIMLLFAFVQAFILSHFIAYAGFFYPDMSGLGIGMITAFWALVGFTLNSTIMSNMFARRPDELTKIEAGYQIVSLLVMGAIIGLWR